MPVQDIQPAMEKEDRDKASSPSDLLAEEVTLIRDMSLLACDPHFHDICLHAFKYKIFLRSVNNWLIIFGEPDQTNS